jgi:1-deoxy-D-xylulose 5-phosphate reductoisomerase
LAEGHDPKKLFEQIKQFKPKIVLVRDETAAKELKNAELIARFGSVSTEPGGCG